MYEIIMIPLLILIFGVQYFIYGCFFLKWVKWQDKSLLFTLLMGMLTQMVVYFLIDLPLKYFIVPVDTIKYVWLAVDMVLLDLMCIFNRKYMLETLQESWRELKSHKLYWSIFAVSILAMDIFLELCGTIYGGDNNTRFQGYVTTSWYEGYLGIYDAFTGTPLTEFSETYFLETYLDHSVIVSSLFHVNPNVVMRSIVMPFFMFLFCFYIWWKLGQLIFENRKQALIFGLGIYALYFALCTSQLYFPFYTFFRTYEGKGILANVITPLYIYLIYDLYKKGPGLRNGSALMVALLTSYMYSSFAIVENPVALASYLPFCFLAKDKKKTLLELAACFGLSIALVVYYILRQKGVIQLLIIWEAV